MDARSNRSCGELKLYARIEPGLYKYSFGVDHQFILICSVLSKFDFHGAECFFFGIGIRSTCDSQALNLKLIIRSVSLLREPLSNMRLTTVFLFMGVPMISAQSLSAATAPIPRLSEFTQLLNSNPSAAANFLTNFSLGLNQQTILVPSNDAFDEFRQTTGSSVASLSSPDLGNILQYHSLQPALSSPDLQKPGGLVSDTALTNPTYDNRGLSSNGAKLPQVVHIASTNTSSGTTIKARSGTLYHVGVKSGEGKEITLEPIPGNWSGGNFYIVDGSVLGLLFVHKRSKSKLPRNISKCNRRSDSLLYR